MTRAEQTLPHHAAGAPSDDAPSDELPYRCQIRRFLEMIWVEKATIALVLVYMLLVLIDLVIEDLAAWSTFFLYTDFTFLCVFVAEHSIRFYAYGLPYLRFVMNVFDAVVVFVSFGFQLHYVQSGGKGQTSFLGVLRLVRLLRLFVVMNKIQSRREQYKRSRHLKLNSSPAERVMELLAEMKAKVAARADTGVLVVDIDWIINLIISEKLYAIELKTDKVDGELSAFLLQSVGARKKKQVERDAAPVPEPDRGPRSGQRRRSSVKMVRISAQALEDAMEMAMKQQATESHTEAPDDPRELNRLEAILLETAVQDAISNLDSWGVDVFDFHEKTQNSGLVAGAHHLMQSYGLIDRFNLDVPKMVAYFRRIQEGYHSNPYHNCVHALDVMLNTSYFMRQEAIAKLFTPLDQLAAILAAAIHDHNHPGLNNQFLIATRHEWAVRYNDQSVLESHHIASAWALLLQDQFNFIAALTPDEYKELRELVIQLILATDMRFHFEHASKLKTRCNAGAFNPSGGGELPREDVQFLLCALVHAADISNGLKPSALALKWSAAVMEEFFRQGDLEVTLGMPISHFYDRRTTSISQCQLGFLNMLVKPYFEPLCKLLGGNVVAEVFDTLLSNINDWETYGDALLQEETGLRA